MLKKNFCFLIELGNNIYESEMAGEEEQPQASNFKKKAELFTRFNLPGSDNSDYRSIIKKMTEATWDYACKITHSQTATYYEVSTCVSLIISLVSLYENIRQKSLDPISQFQCPNCKSKKIFVIDSQTDEKGIISKLFLQCEECGETTEIDNLEKWVLVYKCNINSDNRQGCEPAYSFWFFCTMMVKISFADGKVYKNKVNYHIL